MIMALLPLVLESIPLPGLDASVPADRAAISFVRFVSSFGIFGSLALYFFVLPRSSTSHPDAGTDSPLGALRNEMAASTARVGLAGAVLLLVYCAGVCWRKAQGAEISFLASVQRQDATFFSQVAFAVTLLIAFGLAARRLQGMWQIAAVAAIGLTLRKGVTGKWTALVNPFHEFGASVWLGTLLVLLVVGLRAVILQRTAGVGRGVAVAYLVRKFSPVALVGAGIVGVTGILTSWLHLKTLSALWTTPYGCVLMTKLVFVAVVAALGAWNWRRLTPKLGSDVAALEIRRSAKVELWFAGVVLLITAVLVAIPNPK
jgi:putative copper export protein